MLRNFNFLILVFLIGSSSISCVKSTGEIEHKTTSKLVADDNYNSALGEAEKNSKEDEFDKVFNIGNTITLLGKDIKIVSKIRVNKEGELFLVDSERKVVEKYNPDGNFINTIGQNGNEPGKHIYPSDLAFLEDGSTAISDFQGHRVNIFSNKGEFENSFIYTPQNFSAQRIIFDATNKVFYLCGNRWQKNEIGEPIGAEMIHKYTKEGEYVSSFLPFPEKAKSLDLYNYSFPFAELINGTIYFAFPFDYVIYKTNFDGEVSTLLEIENKQFKFPAKGLNPNEAPKEKAYEYVQNWRTTWTPIVGLTVSEGKLVIQYQTFNKLRYTIDIWSVSNNKLLKTIKTNHLLLTRGEDENLYFLDNLDVKEQKDYRIVKAKIN